MTKKELRRIYSERRQELSASQVAEQSLAIARRFFSFFEIEKIKSVHCYLPIRRKNEVDTFPIIYTIQEHFLQTKVVIPRSLPQTNDLENYLWTSDIQLDLNQWGILEPNPQQSIPYPDQQIDLVVLPLLCFDKQGHRVGYGKGFYDRFLVRCRPNVVKVGVSFFDPIGQIEDRNAWDIPLNFCVTPQRVWEF
jgi:5-formyltetrahydrofolate cyclo-ligase